MIPWHESDWSLTELLAALGLTHHSRGEHMSGRTIKCGRTAVGVFSCFTAVDWLCETGQIEWTPLAIARRDVDQQTEMRRAA